MVSLSFRATRRCLIVFFLPWNEHVYSNLITKSLKTITEPLGIWDNYLDVMGVGVVVISPVSTGLVFGLIGTMPVVDLGL